MCEIKLKIHEKADLYNSLDPAQTDPAGGDRGVDYSGGKHLREYFLFTERIAFSFWNCNDEKLAQSLWGDPHVTRFLCTSGIFTEADIQKRLQSEIACQKESGVQYWPIFHISKDDLIGCCGLHPHSEESYELGFHLRPEYWRQGYAIEAARAVIRYAFETIRAESLFAGHNPKNTASQAVLAKLGFAYMGDEFYPPTGLNHPSYRLEKRKINEQDI